MNVVQTLGSIPSDSYDFKLIESYKDDVISNCMICLEPFVDNQPYYRYKTKSSIGKSQGVFSIHKSCGELPGEIYHPLHHHSHHLLKIKTFGFNPFEYPCHACFTFTPTFKYCCDTCDVNVCQLCISNYVEGQQIKQTIEEFIKYHEHKLQLFWLPQTGVDLYPDYNCSCCLLRISGPCYVCLKCMLFFHESCMVSIPEEVNSLLHPQHPLIAEDPYLGWYPRNCEACQRQISGVILECIICKMWFHVVCGQRTSPGLRVDGEVTLFYFDDGDGDWDSCCICCESLSSTHKYRSIESGKDFHIGCLVPPVVDHPCHRHPLILTGSIERKSEAEKYCCDVCEAEEDFEHYIYHCEECYFMAHIECIFDEASLFIYFILKKFIIHLKGG